MMTWIDGLEMWIWVLVLVIGPLVLWLGWIDGCDDQMTDLWVGLKYRQSRASGFLFCRGQL